jgi:hypothetical protein
MEMDMVVGTAGSGKFIKHAEEENIRFTAMVERALARL